MATEQKKSLMIRGDRLLFALDVIAFLANAWRDVSAYGKIPKELAWRLINTKVNPRGFSWEKTAKVMRRFSSLSAVQLGDSVENVYDDMFDDADAPMNVIHGFLCSASDLAMTTFDAEYVIEASGGNWFVMEDETPINQPLRRFFSAIASGELTEADFKE